MSVDLARHVGVMFGAVLICRTDDFVPVPGQAVDAAIQLLWPEQALLFD